MNLPLSTVTNLLFLDSYHEKNITCSVILKQKGQNEKLVHSFYAKLFNSSHLNVTMSAYVWIPFGSLILYGVVVSTSLSRPIIIHIINSTHHDFLYFIMIYP